MEPHSDDVPCVHILITVIESYDHVNGCHSAQSKIVIEVFCSVWI